PRRDVRKNVHAKMMNVLTSSCTLQILHFLQRLRQLLQSHAILGSRKHTLKNVHAYKTLSRTGPVSSQFFCTAHDCRGVNTKKSGGIIDTCPFDGGRAVELSAFDKISLKAPMDFFETLQHRLEVGLGLDE